MRARRSMRIAIVTGLASGTIGAPSAFGQETIDGGQTVTVPGTQASPWNIGNTLTVGSSGEGTLDITSGGVVTNTEGQVGVNQGSSGTVTVTGPNASWTNSGNLFVGYGGEGALTIANGGTVSSTLSTFIGRSATGAGTVTVTGSGSTLTSTPGGVFVGYGGRGALNILDGGAVISRPGTIGHSATGSGEVLVSGAGSTWTIDVISSTSLGLTIGNEGTGLLTINSGGATNVGSVAHIGSVAGASGTLVVDGGSWTDQGLYVGQYGQGALTITGGGTADSYYAHIGRQRDATGTVTVSGAGSTWTTHTSATGIGLFVGNEGTGTLAISDGGAVSTADVHIGSAASGSGTLTVSAGGSFGSARSYVGHSGTGVLAISGGGAVSNSLGYIGYASGSSGTVTVTDAGSSWTNSSSLYVGSSGTGVLTISGGGAVSNNAGIIGGSSGSSGTVTVTGAGSSWASSGVLYVGNSGTGALTISGGGAVSNYTGYIGDASGSSGTVTVTDAGSSLTTGGYLYVGHNGTGTLTIGGGGAVSSTYGRIGHASGSSGTATVTGAGSSWTTVSFNVGSSGTGVLAISDSGAVSSGATSIGASAGSSGTATVTGDGSAWTISSTLTVGSSGEGTLSILSGATTTNTSGIIGNAAGALGSVTVDNARWINSGLLHVGQAGTGALAISGGGVVGNSAGYIGYASGSSGMVTVAEAGSSWTNSGDLYVGRDGTGALTISDGGAVSNAAGYIGSASGSSGTVTVTDAGSLWTSRGNLYVGSTGTGALTISDGGAVGNAVSYIGYTSGSSGIVTVTDTGSRWTSSGQLQIGRGDDGRLSILNGGTVTSDAGVLGVNDTATGTATVDGAGSAWTSGGNIVVGNNGTGTLAVSGGGLVENANGFIAAFAGSTGVVTVTGPGSIWSNTNTLHVGYQGTGTLSIVDSGRVTASGGVTVAEISGGTGALEVASGGLLETFALAAGDGAAQVTFNGGKLIALGDNMDFITGFTGTTLDIAADGLTLDTAGHVVATDQSGFSGAGALTKSGSGTLILRGDNSHAGGTAINEGTLQIGDGGTAGSIVGDVAANAALIFNRSDDLAFSGAISGAGTVTQAGTGILTLTGDSSGFGGASSVAAGTLMVEGSLGGTVAVASGGALGGVGTVGGTATIAAGGALIGLQGETLSFGSDLILASGAIVDVSLGAPGTDGLFNVAGNLTLDGQLDITDLGGFGPGLYRLFDYAGALTDNGLGIGTVPAGSAASDLFVQTSVAQQVNLVNTSGVTLNYWDGDDTSLHNNGIVDGGDGTWNLANPNWTESGGAFDAPWANGGFAVFTGQAGTVTVDAGPGALAISGAQFATNGYRIEGDAITLTLPETILRVGFGARNGASVTATIASELTGSGGLEKTDFGTLILTGANSYTGGTIISGGTLQLGEGGTAGSILGDVVNNGIFAINRSDAFTFSGTISGTGGFRQAGAGTTILTADNSYTGGTTITAGTLQLGNGGTRGSITGDIVNNAALAFNRSDALTFGGAISGTGSVTQAGTGTTILTGDSNYTGGTTIAAGTLQLGDGGTSGGITGNIANNAVLVFNRSDTLALGGVISGTGSVTQAGAGTTILTGANSYTGGTTIAAGALQLGDGGATGSITGDVTNNGALLFRRSNLYSFAGTISGTGSVVQAGTGTTVLSAVNGYSGGTVIEGGTLSVASDANLGAASGGLTFDGGTLLNTAAFTSARAVALGNGGGTFQTDADLTLSGAATGSGELTKAGSGALILIGANSHTGGTTIAAGTLRIGNGGTGGSITGDVANNGTLVFNRSNALGFAGAISGTGSLVQLGAGTTTLTGINSYTGATRVEAGTLVLAVPQAIAAAPVSIASGATYALDFSGNPASLSFDNALTGAGLMRVDLGDTANVFALGGNVGAAFTGTVALGRSSFELSGDSTAALANATLRLDTGNLTTIGTGTQAIGNLTLNGGNVIFPIALPPDIISSGLVSTGALTLTSGTLTAAIPEQLPGEWGGAGPASTLLQQDDLILARLIAARNLVGSASNLMLVDDDGTGIAESLIGITQGGNVVAVGHYGYNLTTGAEDDGLYVAYGLSQLDLQPGQTLTLMGDDGTKAGSDLHALVTGDGNLAIAATDTITLGNAANDYTGMTTVTAGTLALGADHVLGLSSLLTVDAGATADISGRTQAVGALDIDGALVLNGGALATRTTLGAGTLSTSTGANVALGGGTLTIANGGATAAGTLSGAGSLNLTGGTLAVDGANAALTANIAIAPGATALLTNAQGLGTGAIANAGTLALAGANGTLANALSGAGTVGLMNAAAVTLSGDNSGFSGVFAIAQGTSLTASLPQHLGNAAIHDNGRLVIDTSADWSLANPVTGTGSLVKQGSGALSIITNQTYSGGTTVSAGTLIVGTPTSPDGALSGGGDTHVAAGATLGGYGRVHGTVTNDGTIAVRDAITAFSGAAKGAFTINSGLVNNALAQIGGNGIGNRLIVSNYTGGAGSVIALNAYLGDDGAASDMLVIDGGTATGHSDMRITNAGGAGALTTGDGIRVVDAINGATTAASAFGLATPVVAGPYEYSLYRGGLGTGDEDWYLRSNLDCTLDPDSIPCQSTDDEDAPDYRREDSLYATLPTLTLLYGGALIASMHERMGTRDPRAQPATSIFWSRAIGAHEKYDGDALGIYGAGPAFDYDFTAIQGGFDYLRAEHDGGASDRLGVYFAYGRLAGDVDHYTGGFAGDSRVKAYAVGHYWTHVGARGWYVDAVLQATRYELDASSHRGLADIETEGRGFAASLEGGYPFALGSHWSLEPQAQIVYQRVSLDPVNDSVSTVRFRNVRSLAGRVGLRLSHDFVVNPDANESDPRRGTWWLRADLSHEFENDPVTRFSSDDGPVDLDNDLGGAQIGLTTAVSAELAERVNVHASGGMRYRLDGDNFGYQGSIGVKIAF